ncbi:GntR family transcriptional regulator [Lacticaseibacillus saniviri]
MAQPQYQQILDILKQQIQTQQLPPGSQLPTEMQLAEQYGVSRITSKRALTELESAGFIERVQGRGSFVKQTAALVRTLTPLQSVTPLQQAQVATDLPELAVTAQPLTQISDGTILFGSPTDEELNTIYKLISDGISIRLFSLAPLPALALPTLQLDWIQAGRLATSTLIRQHHQRIGFWGPTSHPAYSGYVQSLLQTRYPLQTPPGHGITDVLSAGISELDGLIVSDPIQATRVLGQLQESGVHVGQDFGLIVIGNLPGLENTYPLLSRLNYDLNEFRQWMNATEMVNTQSLLTPHLIQGDSL